MEVDSVLPADPEASSRRQGDHTWRLTTTRILIVAGVGICAAVAISLLALRMSTACSDKEHAPACTRVLFIGNSYTTVNDLPSVFASLARSGGHRVETGSAAVDGWTLADHAGSSATAMTLASKNWDIVVLQEQSQIPSVESFRQNQMYPAARRLIDSIRNQDAQPLFYLTWGHRDGWPENAMPDYAHMQTAIDDGYLAIARDQRVAVAPVGDAWATLVARRAGATLWQQDGSHPTEAGTYLAACVFYTTIFRESPKGLGYRASLSAEAAATIQEVAADTVLTDPAKWPGPSE
jgi:hypothetical protein